MSDSMFLYTFPCQCRVGNHLSKIAFLATMGLKTYIIQIYDFIQVFTPIASRWSSPVLVSKLFWYFLFFSLWYLNACSLNTPQLCPVCLCLVFFFFCQGVACCAYPHSCCTMNTYRFKGTHSEQVGHHGGESWRQAALRYKTQLQLGQANDIVSLFPVPRWYVQQVRLDENKCIYLESINWNLKVYYGTLLWYCISCMMTRMSSLQFLIEITLIILAASSASGSWQYLLASTRQASASCTFWDSMGFWGLGGGTIEHNISNDLQQRLQRQFLVVGVSQLSMSLYSYRCGMFRYVLNVMF